jgi:hypothetical protein
VSETPIALAVAFAACIQATTGMGFALILSPVLLVVLAPTSAIVLMTALSLTLNLLVLFRRRGPRRVAWREVRPMLLAAVPGSLLGLALLRSLPKPALELGVGVTVLSLTLARLLVHPARERRRNERAHENRARRTHGGRPGHARSGRLAVGLLAGALSTAIGVNGPPLAMWLGTRRLGVATIRDSLAALFLGMGTVSALTLAPTFGDVHLRAVVVGCCFAGVVIGHALGSHLHLRLAPEMLERLLSLIVLASGASAVVFGLTAL